MNDSIYDSTFKQHHIVEQRANQLAEDMLQILKEEQAIIIGKLALLEERFLRKEFDLETAERRKAVLLAQKEEVEKVVTEIYDKMKEPLQDAALDVMTYMSKDTVLLFSPILDISASIPKLSKSIVDKWFEMSMVDGLLVNEWLSKLEESERDRIIKIGRKSMIESLGSREMARLMRKEGIEGTMPALEGLARTFLQSAAHYAKETTMEDCFGDFITGWEFLATLDRRTCPICGALDRKVFRRGEYRPSLPLHWRCRCVYIARCKFSDNFDNMLNKKATRTAVYHSGRLVNHRDGSKSTKFSVDRVEFLPYKTTYESWLRSQLDKDPAFVRSVLGKTRFELFKAGKISLKSMSAHGKLKKIADLL